MNHLILTVRFLDPRFHGRGDGGRREWPPSPMRLFSALLAGSKAHWSEERDQAFRWLESKAAPMIQAVQETEGNRHTVWVPNNDSEVAHSRIDKTIHPTLLGDPPEVDYIWPLIDGEEPLALTIAEVAGHIRALGWGIDLAIGRGACHSDLPPRPGFRVYKPRAQGLGGGQTLRVPCPGSLEALEAGHEASLRLIQADGSIFDESVPKVFATAAYAQEADRAYCAFQLETPDEERFAWEPRKLKELVGMVRHLASGSEARQGLEEIDLEADAFVLGHQAPPGTPRLSILPVPSIGHPHSDGRIRRILLAEPTGSNGEACRKLESALNGRFLTPLPGEDLVSEGQVCLTRLPPGERFLHRFTQPSRRWASVTPVLLPGYDERKADRMQHRRRLERAEQLVCKAMQQAGIDVPATLELSRVPYWPGTLKANCYEPREKLAHYPRWHVRLCFDRAVAGPLVMGAGRHCGFGLFASLDE